MKRIILLLAITIVSCSTHPVAPPATPDTTKQDTSRHKLSSDTPSHPFPSAYREVDVRYQNLPGTWKIIGRNGTTRIHSPPRRIPHGERLGILLMAHTRSTSIRALPFMS